MKQRRIIGAISPDFQRDGETAAAYITRKEKQIVDFVSAYVRRAGMDGLVLGVSGGVDSFLAGALCARAMEKTGKELYLVLLPNGEQEDFADARDCAARIREIYPQTRAETISIRGGYDGARSDLLGARGFTDDVVARGNLQPRLRMMYQYALANKLLVVGTDHAAEAAVGFYTKYGDGGTDINPLQELVKDDIYSMAERFGAPKAVLTKKPAAGLGISADDEAELNMKYSDICAYLKGNKIDAEARQKLEQAYAGSMHKRRPPASLRDEYAAQQRETVIVVDLIHAFLQGGALACQKAGEAVRNTVRYINEHPNAHVLYARDSPWRRSPGAGGCLRRGGHF